MVQIYDAHTDVNVVDETFSNANTLRRIVKFVDKILPLLRIHTHV